MNLVRQILLETEAADGRIRDLEIEGHDRQTIAYHVEMMDEAGLLDSDIVRSEGSHILFIGIKGLTWEGHDFLDAARNDKVWNQAKDVMKKEGVTLPFSVLKDLLKQITAQLIFGA